MLNKVRQTESWLAGRCCQFKTYKNCQSKKVQQNKRVMQHIAVASYLKQKELCRLFMLLSVPKVTANMYRICLNILQIYTWADAVQILVTFGTLSIFSSDVSIILSIKSHWLYRPPKGGGGEVYPNPLVLTFYHCNGVPICVLTSDSLSKLYTIMYTY